MPGEGFANSGVAELRRRKAVLISAMASGLVMVAAMFLYAYNTGSVNGWVLLVTFGLIAAGDIAFLTVTVRKIDAQIANQEEQSM